MTLVLPPSVRGGSGGGVAQQRHAVADAAYSAVSGDTIIAYTSISAARTVTGLTSAGTATVPFLLYVVDESGSASSTNTITFVGSSGNIDGAASRVIIDGAHGWWAGYTNGTNWFTLATGKHSAYFSSSATSAVPPSITWTSPTLLNSWVSFGAPYYAPGYYKDALGFVHLRGIVKSGTPGATIFTLPVGYRPTSTVYFPGVNGGIGCAVQVDSSGNVQNTGSGNASASLACHFYAEQ